MYTFEDLIRITAELRGEGGCPWDREQTHESLKQYLYNECEEVVEAIDKKDMENLCEELGDVLYQVIIHSQIAKEENQFDISHVIDGICEKMVRRHPHVFGDVKVNSPEESLELWEEIKKQERAAKQAGK